MIICWDLILYSTYSLNNIRNFSEAHWKSKLRKITQYLIIIYLPVGDTWMLLGVYTGSVWENRGGHKIQIVIMYISTPRQLDKYRPFHTFKIHASTHKVRILFFFPEVLLVSWKKSFQINKIKYLPFHFDFHILYYFVKVFNYFSISYFWLVRVFSIGMNIFISIFLNI